MTEPLLDRTALGQLLGLSPRSISRLKHAVPADVILPGGRPRWRRERVEAALTRMARNRRPRAIPPRGDSGRFVHDEADVGTG